MSSSASQKQPRAASKSETMDLPMSSSPVSSSLLAMANLARNSSDFFRAQPVVPKSCRQTPKRTSSLKMIAQQNRRQTPSRTSLSNGDGTRKFRRAVPVRSLSATEILSAPTRSVKDVNSYSMVQERRQLFICVQETLV